MSPWLRLSDDFCGLGQLRRHLEISPCQSLSDSTDTAPFSSAHFSNPGGGFLIPRMFANLMFEIFSHLQSRKSTLRKSAFERLVLSRSESLRSAPFKSAFSRDASRRSAERKVAPRKFAELKSAYSSRDLLKLPLRTSAPRKFARSRSAPARSIP